MRKSRSTLMASTGLIAAVLAFPTFALSQTADAPVDGTEVEEVVVMARGRVEQLKDVAVSASVTSGAALETNIIRNLQDLSARIPNFKINVSGTSDFLNIRGIGSSANTGFEQSVATFVDGVYRSRSRSSRSTLFDVERVEVLRGPQTTFFGNNAIAGALNVITRKPGTEYGGNVSAYYGDYGEYSAEAGVNLPLSDTLSARIAARAAGMEGYIENSRPGVGNGPQQQSFNGRLSVSWRPSDNFELDGRLDIGRTHDKNSTLLQIIKCPPDPVFTAGPRGSCLRYVNGVGAANVEDELDYRADNGPSAFDLNYEEAAITGRWDVGGLKFTSITSYYNHDNRNLVDTQPVPLPYASVTGTTVGLPTNYIEKFRQVSQELRVQTPTDRRVSFTAGVYAAKTDADWDNSVGYYYTAVGNAIGRPGDPVAARVLNTEESTTLSAFGQVEIHLTEQLRLDLAARYTNVHKEAHRVPMVGMGGNLPGAGGTFTRYTPEQEEILRPLVGEDPGDFARPERDDSKFMPAATLQYTLSDDAMVYGSYARGFKAGGYSVITSASIFDPEVVDAFEAGTKFSAFERRMVVNLAAFYSKYKDLQQSSTVILPSGVSVSIVGNAAQALSKGVEGNIIVRPTDRLTLTADVAYLDSRFESYPNAPCTALQVATRPTPCRQDLKGQRTAFAPEYSGNLGFQFRQPVGDEFEMKLGANVYFSTEYFLNAVDDPYVSQSGFSKLDARVAFGPSDASWELAIVGKNLTDEITKNYSLNSAGSSGSFNALVDAPRTVGVQVMARF